MAETYSLGVTGLRADTPFTTENITLPDSAVQGATNNNPNGLLYEMRNNTQILCKGPDGALKWYTLDAERSTPATPILKAV